MVPLRLLALYTTDLSVLADEMGLVLAEPATANTVVVPKDGAVLTDQVAPLALALADLFTLPGHGDAEAEQLRDALARTEQAWEACCTSTPEYVLARSALLDPLAALDAHLDNLILVGAQAIYHHTGDADLNVPLLTTDALTPPSRIHTHGLAAVPEIGSVLRAAGFTPGSPVVWSRPCSTTPPSPSAHSNPTISAPSTEAATV